MMQEDTSTKAQHQNKIFAGRYREIRLLGKGGMGAVYLAEDINRNNKKVAIKKINYFDENDNTNILRFKEELRNSLRVADDNVIQIYDFDKDEEGQYYISMEYVEGGTLAQILQEEYKESDERGIPFLEILQLAYGMARGIAAIHKQGIVHRDIKPANVLISKDGEVKIADFGVARAVSDEAREKLTKEASYVGTETYIPHEQILKSAAPHPSMDVYAFGVVVYEMVTGERPFETPFERLVVEEVPGLGDVKKDVPEWFKFFIEKCLARDPADRFQSMSEACIELEKRIESIGALVGDRSGELDLSRLSKIRMPGELAVDKRRALYKTIKSFFAHPFIVAMIVSAVHLYLTVEIPGLKYSGYVGKWVDGQVSTLMFKARGQLPAPEGVAIVSVDESGTDDYEDSRSPTLRTKIAEAITKLSENGVRAAYIDILFDKPLNRSERAVDEAFRASFATMPVYLVRMVLGTKTRKLSGEEAYQIKNYDPFSEFKEAAAGTFIANVPVDNGVVRYMDITEAKTAINEVAEVIGEGTGALNEVPNHYDMINYYGPAGSIASCTVEDVINEECDLKKLAGRVVFIGKILAPGSVKDELQRHDTFLTAYGGGPVPGVEIHATRAANIMEGNWIRILSPEKSFMVSVFTAWVLTYLLLTFNALDIKRVVILAVGWSIAAFFFFLKGWLLPGATLMILLFTLAIVKSDMVNERWRKFLKNTGLANRAAKTSS